MVYQGGNVKYRLELSAVSTDQSAERVLVAADQWEVLWSSHPGTDSGEAGREEAGHHKQIFLLNNLETSHQISA